MTTAVQSSTFAATLRDIVALTKPRITALVVITAAGGIGLAPGVISLSDSLLMLLTTSMVVAAANALNCYLERDSDRFMARTATRPLPDGRLQPAIALWFGVAMGCVSVPVLWIEVNPMTGLLGLIAITSYVFIYTPMKAWTPAALLVGAVPGALPPLMGWTAVTGRLDVGGLSLFAVMFFWQIPHFIAISIFRQQEYEAAGLRVLPSVRGRATAKRHAAIYTVALMASSLALYTTRTAGEVYLVAAIVLGAWFAFVVFSGMRAKYNEVDACNAWAKHAFVTSLVYLTTLFAAIGADALCRV